MTWVMALIGVCMGSFGNVLIDRLPRAETIIGRSRCDACHRVLSWYELVPIVSWLMLRGKCRTCGARIPWRLPMVEAVSGVVAYAAFASTPAPFEAASFFVGLWALLLIAVIDVRTRTIPDVLTVVVLLSGIALHWSRFGTIPTIAPLVLAAFFAAQWILSRGQWVGSGDILLAGAIGMFLGTVQGAVWTLILSYIFGAATATGLLLAGKLRRGDMVPFGPFLVLAAYCVLLLGERLTPIPLG